MNKVATAVQLRFNIAASPSLPEEVKARLIQIAGSRVTSDGVLLIESHQYRTQEQNRAAAQLRLVDLLRQAAEKPKPRKKNPPRCGCQSQTARREAPPG